MLSRLSKRARPSIRAPQHGYNTLRASSTSTSQPADPWSSTSASMPPEILDVLSSSGFLRTFSDLFLHMPQSALCPTSTYASTIILLVLAIRSGVTLPVNLWQRSRSHRLQHEVAPQMESWALKAREELRVKCRRENKSYEEYVDAFKAASAAQQKKLEKEHRCQPRLTLFAPLAVHLPVFMLATASIRDVCIRASSFKSYIIESTMGLGQPSPSTSSPSAIPGMDALTSAQESENAKSLLQISNETFLGSDQALLVNADPSLFLPAAVGLSLLFNTELSAFIRGKFLAAREKAQTGGGAASPVPPAAIKQAQQQQQQQSKGKRGLSSTSTSLAKASAAPSEGQSALRAADSKFTPALRLLSVAMIIVASQAPIAVNLYWITSNVFTLVQNSVFAWKDQAAVRLSSRRRPS